MKTTFAVLVLLSVSLATSIPIPEDLPIHDALKAAMKPEMLEELQRIYHYLRSSNYQERSAAGGTEIDTSELDVATESPTNAEQCLNFYLDEVSNINRRVEDDIKFCEKVHIDCLKSVEVTALNAKRQLDDVLKGISQQFLVCKNDGDVEEALQCYADLSSQIEVLQSVIDSAKDELERISKDKAVFRSEMNQCTSDVISRATSEISSAHSQLLACTSIYE